MVISNRWACFATFVLLIVFVGTSNFLFNAATSLYHYKNYNDRLNQFIEINRSQISADGKCISSLPALNVATQAADSDPEKTDPPTASDVAKLAKCRMRSSFFKTIQYNYNYQMLVFAALSLAFTVCSVFIFVRLLEIYFSKRYSFGNEPWHFNQNRLFGAFLLCCFSYSVWAIFPLIDEPDLLKRADRVRASGTLMYQDFTLNFLMTEQIANRVLSSFFEKTDLSERFYWISRASRFLFSTAMALLIFTVALSALNAFITALQFISHQVEGKTQINAQKHSYAENIRTFETLLYSNSILLVIGIIWTNFYFSMLERVVEGPFEKLSVAHQTKIYIYEISNIYSNLTVFWAVSYFVVIALIYFPYYLIVRRHMRGVFEAELKKGSIKLPKASKTDQDPFDTWLSASGLKSKVLAGYTDFGALLAPLVSLVLTGSLDITKFAGTL